ncbi:g407 [Coccomyxa viridis]|uniref:G407 protein n=1 Tax=Coccomyxa viridis TaxID=1274662 RepID=A0ABP1FH91_9CHLO
MEKQKRRWRSPLIATAILLLVVSVSLLQRRSVRVAKGIRQQPRSKAAFRFKYDKFCDALFNSGNWVGIPRVGCDPSTLSVATCGPNHTDNWQWSSDALRCGAHRLSTAELQAPLSERWVVVAGDSIARFFFAALLRLLSGDGKQQVVYGHRDFEYMLPGNVRASFIWAPYAANLTTMYTNWTRSGESPHVVVMSAGLWHMLHIHSPADFAKQLQRLKQAMKTFLTHNKAAHPVPVSFFSISEVYPPKLKTEEKRLHLTLESVDLYNRAIQDAGLLVPDGALYLVDMHHLTQGCGPSCTHDGLHYSNATYDAALQIWANNYLSLLSATSQ